MLPIMVALRKGLNMAGLLAAAPAIGAVSSLVGAASGLFGSKPKAPPPVSAPTPMPLPDDAANKRAAQTSLFAKQQASGRASTLIQGGGANPGTTGSTVAGGG